MRVHTHTAALCFACRILSLLGSRGGGRAIIRNNEQNGFCFDSKKNVELFDLNEYFAKPGFGTMTAIAINMLSHVYTV